jgi:choline dehydrogenase-like flavoprotein
VWPNVRLKAQSRLYALLQESRRRAHEVDNLYVVDGSPFPTGAGANPTLTTMANAWPVAENVVKERAR